MSTFDGLVDEFPDIRIDHFRRHVDRKPPAACFLSHVHSDHLVGLESLKMPFVYCSVVTRRILLRMEKYPHRINAQKGILEVRKQTYRHLKSLLRALPLQTPIRLELGPKITISVTLLDANHCPGAVMFLIQGDGKAILYTGDIRAESWWVNSLVRNPIMLPFSCGHRRLDCIYMDTTFASHEDVYKEFPSKAAGLEELLRKIDDFPRTSVFYFRAWTLGYEDIWIALSSSLGTRVHVDEYQSRLFAGLAEDCTDLGAALSGVQVGNQIQPGCLTSDDAVSLHSCEPGMECHTRLLHSENTVWITPIISRSADGVELAELGAGGGAGDLYQTTRLELEGEDVVEALREYYGSISTDVSDVSRLEESLERIDDSGNFRLSLEGLGLDQDQEVSLKDFVKMLSKRGSVPTLIGGSKAREHDNINQRQSVIHFPYSRHSSLSELRHLISALRPRDICPCTVDPRTWTENISMQHLFGDLCSGRKFHHDKMSRAKATAFREAHVVAVDNIQKKRKRTSRDNETGTYISQVSTTDDAEYESVQTARHPQSSGDHGNDDNNRTIQRQMMATESATDTPLRSNLAISPTDSQHDFDFEYDQADVSPSRSTFDPEEIICDRDTIHQFHLSDQPHVHPGRQDEKKRRGKDRIAAYQAAKACLSRGDSSEWDGLHLRSLGWKGHNEEEIVL